MKKITRKRFNKFLDWCNTQYHCCSCKYFVRYLDGLCYMRWLKDNKKEKSEDA